MRITPEEEQFLFTNNQLSMLPARKGKKNSLEGFVSPRDYANMHGVHPHTVLNWIRAGRIPAISKPSGTYIRYLIPINAKPPMRRTIDRR